MEEMRKFIREEFENIRQRSINDPIDQFLPRVQGVVESEGGHIKHMHKHDGTKSHNRLYQGRLYKGTNDVTARFTCTIENSHFHHCLAALLWVSL